MGKVPARTMIKIEKFNETYLKIYCDDGIAQELYDYFSFEVPGARFHPLYKSKMWDGKLRLFSMFTQELYVGLKSYLEHFAEVNNYSIDESNYVKAYDHVTYNQVKEFCDGLNLGARGEPLAIREYQIDAIYQAINDGRRLLLSPTGSGKSLILYCLMRWHLRHGRKQLILVPTTSLVEQLHADFKDYSCLNGFKVTESCHKIYAGHDKTADFPIVISTWQSIYQLPKKFFENFQCIYGDEAHLFKAKSLTSILHKCVNTPYRVGTTGTLDGTKTHKLVLEGLFGPVYKVTTTKKLMDNDQLTELKIFCLVLDHSDEDKKIGRAHV